MVSRQLLAATRRATGRRAVTRVPLSPAWPTNVTSWPAASIAATRRRNCETENPSTAPRRVAWRMAASEGKRRKALVEAILKIILPNTSQPTSLS